MKWSPSNDEILISRSKCHSSFQGSRTKNWSRNGVERGTKENPRFTEIVLPHLFSHSSTTSFTHQLNVGSYYHGLTSNEGTDITRNDRNAYCQIYGFTKRPNQLLSSLPDSSLSGSPVKDDTWTHYDLTGFNRTSENELWRLKPTQSKMRRGEDRRKKSPNKEKRHEEEEKEDGWEGSRKICWLFLGFSSSDCAYLCLPMYYQSQNVFIRWQAKQPVESLIRERKARR